MTALDEACSRFAIAMCRYSVAYNNRAIESIVNEEYELLRRYNSITRPYFMANVSVVR